MISSMNKTYIIVAALIIAVSAFVFLPSSNNQNLTKESEMGIKLTPQSITDQIKIDSVKLNRPGYVVVRGVADGKLSQILEVSNLLPAGVTNNLVIDLPKSAEGNGSVIVILYEDDGDGGFNSVLDKPVSYNGDVVALNVKTGNKVDQTLFDLPGQSRKADVVIEYTDNGFVPNNVTIERGKTVSFVNKSTGPMWVASDDHPTHTILPTFDQFMGTEPGTIYQYTFDKTGDWKFHDHINPIWVGTVKVVESTNDTSMDEVEASNMNKNSFGYYEVSPEQFEKLVFDPNVTTVNVHIPYQGEIEGTDAFVPYNDIQALVATLPKDKSAPVALYCRSGGMSAIAAKKLSELGYSNVYDLTGGMNAYRDSGRKVVNKKP